jgi:hypothetical protein
MSLFDHLDPQERTIAEAELNEWIDRNPAPEPPITSTCGHCIHFDSHNDIDGIRGMCRAKTELEFHDRGALTVCLPREATDEICDRFIDMEAVPF